jgi:thioredoxin reductase (NADPH)
MENLYDVIIIGSGPSGLTAAIYTTRANLKTLVLAGRAWGGQLMLTTEVENFPGFPEGIMGPDLMMNMRKQAEHHGAEILDVNFKDADFSKKPFVLTTDDDKTYTSKSVIIATGADTKWMEVPGEKEKIGRGISSCAPCDGAFYRGKNVIVVGGGDSAMEEALVMTKFANEVTLMHRRDAFRASDIMQQRVRENSKIKIMYNTKVVEVLGEIKVTGVKIENTQTHEISEMPIDGIFVAIGHNPNSTIFKGVDTDEKGFIKIYDHALTNNEGVFVAGDVHDTLYKQGITAAGFGCMAALEVEKWLMDQNS